MTGVQDLCSSILTHSEAHQIFILGLHTALLMQAVGRPITTGRRRGFVEWRGGLRGGRVAGVGWMKGIAEGRMEGRRDRGIKSPLG